MQRKFTPYKKSKKGLRLEKEAIRILQTMYPDEVDLIDPLCLTHKKVSGYKIPDIIAAKKLQKSNKLIVIPIQVKAWTEFSTTNFAHKAIRDAREDRSALETSEEFRNDIIGPAILYNYWPSFKWPKKFHHSEVVITNDLRPTFNHIVSIITKYFDSDGKCSPSYDFQSRIDDF